MQDPFAPVDPFGKPYEVSGPASALLGIGAGKQAGKSSKAKPKAKAKAKVLEDPLLNPKKQKQGPPIPAGYKAPVSLDEALLLPKGSLLPPGQENKPRKENRQRLSKTWKALEGRGLSAQDLELAQSVVFMSMKDRDGNELSPVEGERNLAEFKPTITEKEALDIIRDPLKRAEAEGQRKAWREMRKISTAQKEGKPWKATDTEPGFVPGSKELNPATLSHQRQQSMQMLAKGGLEAINANPKILADAIGEIGYQATQPFTGAAQAEKESTERSLRMGRQFDGGIGSWATNNDATFWQDLRTEVQSRIGEFTSKHGVIGQVEKAMGMKTPSNFNAWVSNFVGMTLGAPLEPFAAIEYAGDPTKPVFDRAMAAFGAVTSVAGGKSSVLGVLKKLEAKGVPMNAVNAVAEAVAKDAPANVKAKAQAILDDIRTNSPKLDDPDVSVAPVVVQQNPKEVPVAQIDWHSLKPTSKQEYMDTIGGLKGPYYEHVSPERKAFGDLSDVEWAQQPSVAKKYEPLYQKMEQGDDLAVDFGVKNGLTNGEITDLQTYAATKAQQWMDAGDAKAMAPAATYPLSPETLSGPLDESELRSVMADYMKELDRRENRSALSKGPLDAKDKAELLLHTYLGKAFHSKNLPGLSQSTDTLDDLMRPDVPGGREAARQMLDLSKDLGVGDTRRSLPNPDLAPPKQPKDTPAQASTTVEPPITPEAPQNAVETPKITLDDARQIEDPKARREALKQAWASRAKEAAQGNEGSLASGVDPDFLRYVYDVGKTYVEEGVADFAAWSKAMLSDLGDEIRPHLEKAWATVKPNKDFGLAAQFEPEGRAASEFLNVEDLAKRGEELVTSGQIVPENVYKKAVYDGHVTPDEIAAIAYRGKAIENRTAVIEKELSSGTLDDAELGARMAELSTLQSEMGSVLEVGDVAQKTFHQTGQALQVAFSPTYTPVRVKAMAKAYNYGEELDPKIANRLDTLTNSLTEAKGRISKLESDLDKALKDRATRAGGTRSADPATKKVALLRAINSDLGLDKYTVTAPGIRGKTTGAVSVPKNKQKAMAGYVNSLTRLYIEEGASTLDEVVKRFQGDMPLLSRDDVLGLLNKEYREATLEADVHKLEIQRALRMVQEGAKRARTSLGKRMLNESGDAVLTLQRGMQAGLDTSLSFIQGLPGLQVSPSSWGKAWVPWFKTVFAKDAQQAMARNNAMIHADPAFKFARKAGVGFADVSGSYAMQEEVLLGHLVQKARESRIPVAKQYFELLARSQEGGTAFLNKLRLDLFKKFAAGNYKDEQTLKDAAMLANILTGRGSGAMADALSAKPFGYIGYAPRYGWSKYQNAALPILLPTKITSKAGRKAAASAWSKQMAAAYLAAPYIAQSLGLDVETDMRYGEYGAITLPNGSKLRLFKHFMEPVAFLTQVGQGRFSRTGNFTKPGYGSSQIAGQYFLGKGSPFVSTGYRQLTHNRYDQKTMSGVEFDLLTNPEDVKLSAYELFTPLSLQNAFQNLEEGDNLGAFLSMMGIEYSPAKGTETTASGRR